MTVVPIWDCLDDPATADSWGTGVVEGVENDSNEISSCWILAGDSPGGDNNASRSVSEGGPVKIIGGFGEREGSRSNIVLYFIAISVLLGMSSSGDIEWSTEGKEASFKGEGVKDGICRARGGGDGLSCARIMRLASTDEGSMMKY